MPELPEMQGLAERVAAAFGGARVEAVALLGFTGLKTVDPPPEALVGTSLSQATRRGKFLVLSFSGDLRALIHLSQAGRVDLEAPAKATHPRGGVVRFLFDIGSSLLVREHGTQRKAGWWVLGAGDDGPLATLGPEPDDPTFEDFVLSGDSRRHLHTLLRDQRTVAGIGRGHTDDALNRAGLSPFASLASLGLPERRCLLDAVRSVLDEALERERRRTGGLSEAKLGDRFAVHNRAGRPCPRCGEALSRVSFESHEIAYCHRCQTGGRKLADRRLSRLLR